MKISTPEGFDALVNKIEAVAHRNPNYYRIRLQLLACLGYFYLLTVSFLLLGALLTFIGFNLLSLIMVVCWLKLVFIKFKSPTGIPLKRSQVPQLFSMLDELSSALRAPKLHEVFLTDDLNAAVMQRPRFGFIGWQTNYFLIGLPLMQALSTDQCKAVLAHELAHLCGGDGRTAAWIYRIRRTWYELAERYERNGRSNLLFGKFFSWYGPFFRAYSFVHARAQEYEADRRAAEIVGAEHKAEALIWLRVNEMLLNKRFWPSFDKQSRDLEEPPNDSISQMLNTLSLDIASDDYKKWLPLCLASKTDNTATHPCLSERLEALRYEVPALLKPLGERSTTLLGDQLRDLTEKLNLRWKEEAAEEWKEQFELNKSQASRLNSLNAKAEHLLTTEEKIKRAALTWQLADEEGVLRVLQSIVEELPEHPLARYWLGSLLIENQDNEGITHLQFSMENDPDLVVPACRRLYSFYLSQDQPALADDYEQRWHEHQKSWKLAQTERASFDKKTRFVPHDLPDSEIRQLAEYLSSYPEVKAAYLARRVVERFPKYPQYVIILARRHYRSKANTYKKNSRLKIFIRAGIALSSNYTLRFITESEQWHQLRRLPGARIYSD